jgi:hypothetical protein
MTTVVYTSIYGDFDQSLRQPVPVRLFTEATHPTTFGDPRMAAKWWKLHPELAAPDADVTIWIDGNIEIRDPRFPEYALAELGDDDAVFTRHPDRDDLADELAISLHLGKYDGQDISGQVGAYLAAGHPPHWGLAHGAILVRRNNERVRAFDAAWWEEICRWSMQDQLSLAPLMRTQPLRWHWFKRSPLDLGWVRRGFHRAPDEWRP